MTTIKQFYRFYGRHPGEGRYDIFKTILTFFIASLLVSSPLHARPNTAMDSLKVGGGARSLAMGGTGAGSAEGANASHWNPAGLGVASRHEVAFTHARWLERFKYNNLATAMPLSRRWNGGFQIRNFSRADIQGYDDGGSATGQLDVSDLALGATLAGDVGPWFGMDLDRAWGGATLKYLRQDLDAASGSTFAMDLGMRAAVVRRPNSLVLDRVILGASAMNVGPGVTFDNQTDSLPTTYRVGAAARGWARTLTGALDYEKVRFDTGSLRFGLEYQAAGGLALRSGYRWALKDTERTLQNGVHVGMGFQVGQITVDYAYVPFDQLDDTHFISFRYGFGRSPRLEAAEERTTEHYQAAQRAYVRRDFAKAHREVQLVLAVDPSHEGARKMKEDVDQQLVNIQVDRQVAQGKRFMARADYAQALERFETVLTAAPNNTEAFALKQEAEKQIDSQRVERREALLREGEEFYKSGNYEAAIDLLEKVILLDPDNRQAEASLAKAKEKFDEQKRAAAEAAERAQVEMGWAYLNQKNPAPAKALEVAEKTLKTNPDNEAAKLLQSQAKGRLADQWVIEGRKLAQANENRKAYEKLKKALELDTENKIAQDLLDKTRKVIVSKEREEALNLYEQQKYDEALEKLNYLVEVDPQADDLARYRAETIRKLGETKRVQAEIYNREGLRAYDEGNYREALKFWKKTLELVPDHASAKKNMERVRQQLKE